ncbi:MAG TPA: hemerythrin domain-containing protein [Burkholderiaceae bacterium]|nr:hemerythrin domain-containing protein [Burkholderiaceae bacterium]
MSLQRQVPRVLDEEHRTHLHLLDRLERSLARGQEGDLAALAPALRRMVDTEVLRHFAFEEDSLFPRLLEAGDVGIAALLTQEHADIRDLCEELRPLLQALCERAPTPAEAQAFKPLAFELVERMVSHIQKETMGLLPLLDDLLDEAVDGELALAYANG